MSDHRDENGMIRCPEELRPRNIDDSWFDPETLRAAAAAYNDSILEPEVPVKAWVVLWLLDRVFGASITGEASEVEVHDRALTAEEARRSYREAVDAAGGVRFPTCTDSPSTVIEAGTYQTGGPMPDEAPEWLRARGWREKMPGMWQDPGSELLYDAAHAVLEEMKRDD